MFANLVNK